MSRFFLFDIVLFLVPFVIFAIYLFVAERNPFQRASWERKDVIWLCVAGVMVIVVITVFVAPNAGMQLFGRNEAGEAASKLP